MYEEHVLKHYSKPVNKGMLPVRRRIKQYFSEAFSEVCGDRITMGANSHDAILIDLRWEGEGCCFSQAAASMLVEHMEGQLVDHVDAFTDEDMFILFQAECPDARRGCVLVALTALRKLTEQIP